MRIRMRIAGSALCLAIAAIGPGAAFQSRSGDRPRRDPAIEALVFETSNVQPEFAADALIRIAASGQVSDPDWKRELLERAFQRAGAVREAHRRTAFPVDPDTRPGALVQAYDTRLDRVSLQSRVVLAMLPLDSARALELFEFIDLYLEPASCDDPLIPVAEEYYNALTQIARDMARAGGPSRADAFQLFVFYMWRARLPSEMPSVVRAIRTFKPVIAEAVYLDQALRSILEHSVRDARGFSSIGLDLVGKMSDLADDEVEAGLSPSILMQGFRRYLVAQLTGPRCADSVTEGSIAAAFNGVLKHPGVAWHGLDPIAVKDTRPSRILAAARIESYWRAGEARRLHEELVRLRGSGRQPLTESARRTAAWRAQADVFLADLERWTGARELLDLDNFYQRGVLFASLFDLAPQTDLRARAMRGLLDLLRHSIVSRERPALWFLHAARLLDSERGAPRRELLDAFEQSGQPALVLYAHLTRTVSAPARKTN
jgi:hypothetical protein